MILKKDKPAEKPNKVLIDMKFDTVKDSIQERVSGYQEQIMTLKMQWAEAYRNGDQMEMANIQRRADRINKYKIETMKLMDTLENFRFMIDNSLDKMAMYESVSACMGEVTKISTSPQIKEMQNSLKKFEEQFAKQFAALDKGFGTLSSTVDNIETTSGVQMQDAAMQKQLQDDNARFIEDAKQMAANQY